MHSKVVLTDKTKDGREFVIRYPQDGDAPAMLEYINTISAEQTFILYQGETLTLEKEIKFLEKLLEMIGSHSGVSLLVIANQKVVGVADISLLGKAENHVGVLGISLAKDFRGMGIGKKLLELVINQAITSIPNLRIIRLDVFANNPVAMEMYKKFGFVEYGRLPEGLLHRGQYVDHVSMFKKVK